MIITNVFVYKIQPRWIFVKIETDEGVSGWGEMISGTKTEAVAAGALEMGQRIIGRDPFEIERLWHELHKTFFRNGPICDTIVSGLEIALWDIKGKALGVPVYELLGGKVRDRLKVYSWIGGDRPSDVVSAVAERIDMGFDAIKMNATEELHWIDSYDKIDAVVQRVQAIREFAGSAFGIAVDFHGRVHKPMAKVLASALDPFKLMFLEEVVLPENEEAFEQVSRYTSTPLAAGERLITRWGFKQIITKGVLDIIQPDVALTGGILEMRKILAMAEAFDIAAAPHAPYGPVALAATMQVDACSPNVFIQEQSLGIHYNKGYDLLDFVKNKEIFSFRDGFLAIPQGSGLGLDLDEEMIKEVAKDGLVWRNPSWRNYDGTFAEW